MTRKLIDNSDKPLRIFSTGWGWQSVATLVLQAQGKLLNPYDEFVFANVGEDSENPDTLKYYRDIVIPYAAKHQIKILERQKMRKGELDTVYKATLRAETNGIPIPIVFPGSGFGNRTCTRDFKIYVVQGHIKEKKVSHVVMGIGFTKDERHRLVKRYRGWHDHVMKREKDGTWTAGAKIGFSQLYEFPLVDLGLDRLDCAQIITGEGLPLPPKSACWFCPFTSRSVWIDRKMNNDPILDQAIQFEIDVNAKYKRTRAGNHPKAPTRVAIHSDGIPLTDIPLQQSLWDDYKDKDSSCDDVCGL